MHGSEQQNNAAQVEVWTQRRYSEANFDTLLPVVTHTCNNPRKWAPCWIPITAPVLFLAREPPFWISGVVALPSVSNQQIRTMVEWLHCMTNGLSLLVCGVTVLGYGYVRQFSVL